jgi:hypothetical protein
MLKSLVALEARAHPEPALVGAFDAKRKTSISERQTYERILELHPYQGTIFVSGCFETDSVERALELGAETHLRKPNPEKNGLSIRTELNR